MRITENLGWVINIVWFISDETSQSLTTSRTNNGVFEPEGSGTSPLNSVSDSSMCPTEKKFFHLSNQYFCLYPCQKVLLYLYSTLGGKTDKLDEAVNRELNVTKSWNFIQTVDLAWFIPQMSFKLICIIYDFKAPLLENR